MKSAMHSCEDQIHECYCELQASNRENTDPVSKTERKKALKLIKDGLLLLQSNPYIPPKSSRSCPTCYYPSCSLYRVYLLFLIIVILYAGLAPHLAVYTCSSLIRHNYIHFDFIGVPSLMKGVVCIGLTYSSYLRYQPVIMLVHDAQSPSEFGSNVYHAMVNSGWHSGNHSMTDMYLYQDIMVMANYTGWAMNTAWYACTHSAADSTRGVVKWLNKKTQIIVALRDAFIELPVIKQVREAVKAVEDTVDHYVIHPIREKIKEGAQCLMDRLSYFGKRLIQWSKRSEIGEQPKSIEDSK